MTYLDVRLLVDNLKLKPKDPVPPPKPAAPAESNPGLPAGQAPIGKVNVSVDQLARPGALVSGKVTLSDGKSAEWDFGSIGTPGRRARREGLQAFRARFAGISNSPASGTAKAGDVGGWDETHSTVTLLARLRGLSTSQPRATAMW